MFNSLMPSLNVVFMDGFPSRLQNLSSGAIRPGGLLSCELGQIMIKYDCLWNRKVILSNVKTESNLN